MKIFPLRPLSQLDKAKNLIRIVSGEHFPTESPRQVSDLYVKDAIKNTSKLTVNEDKTIKYSVDTKEVARRMTIRDYINKMLKFNKKGE